jgi:hypothetical protein
VPSDFALLGTPEAVVGAVKVTNPTQAVQTVTEVLVRDPGGAADDMHLSVPATDVAPGATVEVQVGLKMNAATPPDAYPLEIVVLGHTYQGFAHVTENLIAGVSPPRVVVVNIAKKQTKQVVVVNRGNIAMHIHSPSAVSMYRERDVTADTVRILSGTADAGDTTATPGIPTPSGQLTATVKGSPVSVGPGDVATLTIEISVASGADQSIRHLAEVPLSIVDLVVVVTPAS